MSPALAQNAPAQQPPAANAFLAKQPDNEWRSSKLTGASVMGPNNQSIDEISDLPVDKNANIQAMAVGVGGFLGMGEKYVAIPFNELTVTRSADGSTIDRVSVPCTPDQLNKAPSFKFIGSKS